MKIQLNIGCGPHWNRGWINTDREPSFTPEILVEDGDDPCALPFKDGTVSRVYMGHLLEHLRFDDQAPEMLREIMRVLQTGGELAVVGPDMDAAIARGEPESLLEAIRSPRPEGAPDTGIYHQWIATEESTLACVRQVFSNSHVADLTELANTGWPLVSTVDWQTGILAVK